MKLGLRARAPSSTRMKSLPWPGADPALLRDDHGHRLLDHRALDLRAPGGLDERAALVAVFLRVLLQLIDDEALQFLVIAKDCFQVLPRAFELFSFLVQV